MRASVQVEKDDTGDRLQGVGIREFFHCSLRMKMDYEYAAVIK
jgi:hypothetical protein